jgi:4-hydroxy 2-oxovalerate aldolase
MRPTIANDVRLTDTTLRDGSHAMAHQFTEVQVRDTARALDRAGVEVIEVSHGDGIGGSSFNYGFSHTDEMTLIAAARDEASTARIAVLLVPGIGTADDLRRARDAGADVVRVATHCTEADVSPEHFALARELGMETVGFLMMAHRTSPEELAKQARIMVDAGCQCPYVTDSAGALLMDDARARFEALLAEVGDEAWVGYHGWTWRRCWMRPRTWCGRTCPAGRRWTATRSCRGGPGCTPRSCCTPSTPPSATRSRPTRSCAAAVRSAWSAARRT